MPPKKVKNLAETLKAANVEQPRIGPLWEGPCKNLKGQGGITQSLINSFLEDRERFRLQTIVGLRETPRFYHTIEYGQMWHLCEEYFAKGEDWLKPLELYTQNLARKFVTQQPEIFHWSNVCKVEFPIYVGYYKKDKFFKKFKPIAQEVVFCVPYKLPSGRVVYLRGKFDGLLVFGKKLFLQENKTKGEVNEKAIVTRLKYDLQTMFYTIAMMNHPQYKKYPLGGVLYNVVRRPLSGGVGSIRKHQPTKANPKGESDAEFYARLSGVIQENVPSFFMRHKVDLEKRDVERFTKMTLDPLLETICEWYNWVAPCYRLGEDPFAGVVHYMAPYGIRNSIAEGYETIYDDHIMTGSNLGLVESTSLFSELEE